MKHIGDDYFEFQCQCGEYILVQSGDTIRRRNNKFLCNRCGKEDSVFKFGKKSEKVICEICRTHMLHEVWMDFPETNENGEQTVLCPNCLMLGDEEDWKRK